SRTTRPYSADASFCLLTAHASRAIASVRSMFLESHVKPSPMVHHSTPSPAATLCSPTFHFSDFRNWTTHTFHPRATARITVPKAAVDLPLPSPVLTTTTDVAFLVARAGPVTGTVFAIMDAPHGSAPPPAPTHSCRRS